MASINTIRDVMRAQPFRPFDVILVDGTRYTVGHPDYLSIPAVQRPREIMYYWVINDSGDDYEYQARWIDLHLISEVVVPSDELIRHRGGSLRPPSSAPPP
jgi:hypothetical protein